MGKVNPIHRHLLSDRRRVEFLGPCEEWLGSSVSKKGQSLDSPVSAEREDNGSGCARENTGRTGAKLGEKVSKILRESPQLRDGRWLSIPVLDEADVEDVEQLLLVKMRPIERTE